MMKPSTSHACGLPTKARCGIREAADGIVFSMKIAPTPIEIALLLALLIIAGLYGFETNGFESEQQFVAVASPTPGGGALRRSSNPHYFTDNSGKAIYLTGLGVHALYQPIFDKVDYAAHLNNLVTWRHNLQRMRLWMFAWTWSKNDGAVALSPAMYQRSAVGGALDGGAKFDLNRFNEAFFTGLRQRVLDAANKGIYTIVILYMSPAWHGHPWNKQNNVNGVNGDANGDGSGNEIYGSHGLSEAILPYHLAYVKKVVDTLRDIDKVIYEVGNELPIASKDFQYRVINHVKSLTQQPIGMSAHGDWEAGGAGAGPYTDLTSSPGEWIAPANAPVGHWRAFVDDPPVEPNKIVINDTDHTLGWTLPPVEWIWKTFTRGHNPLLMDTYNPNWYAERKGREALITVLRQNLGYTRRYAQRMNLLAMLPRPDLASTRYALANPGREYLVFQPGSGDFTVNLSAGTYSVEWFNPFTGQTISAASVGGKGNRTFTPPFKGAAVLYLNSAGSTRPPIPFATPDAAR